jgi:hypothetical protein
MYTDLTTSCTLQTLLFKGFVMKFVDRTGQVFGKLTVIEAAGRNKLKKVLWRCACECGGEATVVSGSLVTGNTTSCGCIIPNLKHGGWNKASYNTWRAMMRRCYNVLDKDYPRWGGRGITVYAPWHDYATFAKNVGEPCGAETFDRIDTDGNYEPSNVRWATPTVQARNIRVPKTSKTGITGVLFHGGSYYANITVKSKKYYSKVCKSLEEAAAARKELERIHWGIA